MKLGIFIVISLILVASCGQTKIKNEENKQFKQNTKYTCPSPKYADSENSNWFSFKTIDDMCAIKNAFPRWLYNNVIVCTGFNSDYILLTHVNPFIVYADFNGDCSLDAAFFVCKRHDSATKLCIVHPNSQQIYLLEKLSDDFSWVEYLEINVKEMGLPFEKNAPELIGDALLIRKCGSGAGGFIYWNGKDYDFIYTEAEMEDGEVDSTDIIENLSVIFR
ncbi:MAG: hypothetical protein JW963_04420 [Anaerolineales bacterium]|nr:hypothetical protein [Anaerolineales bacterium]